METARTGVRTSNGPVYTDGITGSNLKDWRNNLDRDVLWLAAAADHKENLQDLMATTSDSRRCAPKASAYTLLAASETASSTRRSSEIARDPSTSASQPPAHSSSPVSPIGRPHPCPAQSPGPLTSLAPTAHAPPPQPRPQPGAPPPGPPDLRTPRPPQPQAQSCHGPPQPPSHRIHNPHHPGHNHATANNPQWCRASSPLPLLAPPARRCPRWAGCRPWLLRLLAAAAVFLASQLEPCAAVAGGQVAAGPRLGGRRLASVAGGEGTRPVSGGTGPSCPRAREIAFGVMVQMDCKRFKMMCIDQQEFISYDPEYNPRISTKELPDFDVKDVVYNWPNPWGNGDKFEMGRDLHVARVVIRANTSEEEGPDLRSPVFSACTTPLVLWQRWMFNVGEVYETSYTRLYQLIQAGQLDPRLSLVAATPHGMRLPRFMSLFFEALFQRQVTTLAEFSRRFHPGPPPPSNATWEGVAHRCFETLYMCKPRNRREEGLSAAGEHLLAHYANRLPPVTDLFDLEGADRDVLKVVFASRPNATGRAILNEEALLARCNRLRFSEGADSGAAAAAAAAGGGRPTRAKCVGHVFGRDLLYDLSLAKSIDVLVAAHGAAGYHSFFMSRGSSLLEVLPYHFSRQWVNLYYAKMLEFDKKVFYWSIWITDQSHAHPSAFQSDPVFRQEYKQREYHMTLPWRALRQQLMAIVNVSRDPLSYKSVYLAGLHTIGEDLEALAVRPEMKGHGWARYRPDRGAEQDVQGQG